MPLINPKPVEDVFMSEHKGQIVERLTDAMFLIDGENMRGVAWVVAEEVHSGNRGVGGKPLGTDDVRALGGGRGRLAVGVSREGTRRRRRQCSGQTFDDF